MKDTWTRKAVSEITGIPDRRVLFYSEQFILPGFLKAVGRGAAREYTRKDIFYLLITKELDSLGLSLSKIRGIIMTLNVRTIDTRNAPELEKRYGPRIWINGTLTKEPVILVISVPQNPEEHVTDPGSESYDSEVFLQFYTGETEITVLADRPSKIVLNLNQIFNKAGV